MSSNRRALPLRTLLALCLAASAAGCASGDKTVEQTGLLPTEHYAIDVAPHEDQILLAPHAQALSPAQTAALQDLVARWRDAGDGQVKVETPSRGGEEAYRATALIQDALYSLGVRPDQLRVTDYDPGARIHPPVVVGFTRYTATGPRCGRNWTSYTATADNGVTPNFGCANTANVAALVANPGDLLAPRPETPANADRRMAVYGKYVEGQTTSTAKDSQANGAVSSVGN
ncbi:MAG: CpaD family pilus assembly protein [Caulobacteraceae bacterium]|nr:CpaD family pilus assembly protein [Caulobacteraceae bacterium]